MKGSIDTSIISIADDAAEYFGADQEWFPAKWHRMSGCAPTTGALIAMYMAAAFPAECGALYDYALPANRQDFVRHMIQVRPYLKPGSFGLTDPEVFAAGVIAFAKDRGVALSARQISHELGADEALSLFREALRDGLMPALLILRNPSPELDDFTWHWMAVTGFDAAKRTLTISTYGQRYELAFDHVWIQHGCYKAAGVFFRPDQAAENA